MKLNSTNHTTAAKAAIHLFSFAMHFTIIIDGGVKEYM